MITICPGWGEQPHGDRIIADDENNADGHVSHGMCDDCQAKVQAEIDADAARFAGEGNPHGD